MDILDKFFGVNTPNTVDTNKIEKEFKSLERTIKNAVKTLKYSEDEEAKSLVSDIESEFSWFEDHFYSLIASQEGYENALDLYKAETQSRLTEDEQFELVAMQVADRLEKSL